uniref:Uncharacterized protein n=1 Tax=Picea glauca TaxID=3330 RepID=A0A101M2G7_PICGL|nr:hypothetical protein ABT39_MTgene2939 [Picea glauca]QHR86079.1 hypothetical protein Q903MT_gene77 [Picea sitchensis]
MNIYLHKLARHCIEMARAERWMRQDMPAMHAC